LQRRKHCEVLNRGRHCIVRPYLQFDRHRALGHLLVSTATTARLGTSHIEADGDQPGPHVAAAVPGKSSPRIEICLLNDVLHVVDVLSQSPRHAVDRVEVTQRRFQEAFLAGVIHGPTR
jgi:hypothetical protein